ncbi:MAG: hypothetical protein JO166_21035 [Deltaproteobacteria bacterium]|nr:hypothetical protein [Deltaproteobacteria bacterium]
MAGDVVPGAPAGGVATGELFAFTAVSPAVLPGIAGADEPPLTEPPNVEGEVADEPEFPVALAPPAAVPGAVPEVGAPAVPPPAACAYTEGELASASNAAPLRKHTSCFFMCMKFSHSIATSYYETSRSDFPQQS